MTPLSSLLLLAAAQSSTFDIQPVIVSGDPAPVPTFGPAFFNGFSGSADYAINEQGDLALTVGITRPSPPFFFYDIIYTTGLWMRKGGALEYVAASGELVPDNPGSEVLVLYDVNNFNASGQVAFASAQSTNSGALTFFGSGADLFTGDESGLTRLAGKELPALSPELPPGTNYLGWGRIFDAGLNGDLRLNDAGQLVTIGLLEGSSVTFANDELILFGDSNARQVLIREGDGVNGLPSGVIVGCPACNLASSFGNPRLSASGSVFVRAELTGAGDGAAIIGFVNGAEFVVEVTDSSSPTQDRVRILTDPECNEQDVLVFRGGFGTATAPRQVLFHGPAASVQRVLEQGDAAPGVPGATIRALFDDSANPIRLPIAPPIINANGDVVVGANLEGPGITPETERALYFGDPSSLELVVRAGDEPAALPGHRFLSVGRFATNRAGLVVFEALVAPIGSFAAEKSLWVWSSGNEPALIARVGDALPVRGGFTKVPNLVDYRGGQGAQSGFGSQLSDRGVMLFEAQFPDDTGAIYEVNLLETIGLSYCGPAVANSTGASGTIVAEGSDFAASNDVTLRATNLPPNQAGIFLAGRARGFVQGPGGSAGVLCIGGPTGRYIGPGQILNSGAGGEFSLALDLDRTPTPSAFVAVAAGETWNFQAWHRDVQGGAATSNFTDAVEVSFR